MTLPLPAKTPLALVFGVALATGFSGAVVPGSLLAVVVTESVRVGWVAGPLLMAGHGALELVAVVLLVTGLIKFARALRVRGGIGVVGGLVLIYLGYLTLRVPGEAAAQALRSSAGGPVAEGVALAPRAVLRLAFLGALMSMANPYWWLWWATIGVAHVGWAAQRGPVGGATYFVGHVSADVIWYCAVALALSAGRMLFSAGVLRGIYLVCAAFLIVLGAIFVAAGARMLRPRPAGALLRGAEPS